MDVAVVEAEAFFVKADGSGEEKSDTRGRESMKCELDEDGRP